MNFTNEELILEYEIKRKDNLKIKEYAKPIVKEPNSIIKLLGSNMAVLTNIEKDNY